LNNSFRVTNPPPAPAPAPTPDPEPDPDPVVSTPPTVNAITPTSADDGKSSLVLSVAGTNFADGAVLSLTRDGLASITANRTTVHSSTSISATVNIKGRPLGVENIVVTNPNGQSGTFSNALTITKSSTSSSKSSSKSKSKSKSRSSSSKKKSSSKSPSGPITLTKINGSSVATITSSSKPWNTYYTNNAQPWFYGTGETNGTKVEVFSWFGKSLCKAVVSGGAWACSPTSKMDIKIHRIDIKYGSKFLPPFNLRVGGVYYTNTWTPSVTTTTTSRTTSSSPTTPVFTVPTKTPVNSVFGKYLRR